MKTWFDLILIVVLLLDLMLLSSSRIRICVRIAAIQGVLIVFIALLNDHHLIGPGMLISSLFSIVIKGAVFPWLLFRALKEANIRKEVEPVGGYPLSLLFGVVVFALSFWLSGQLLHSGQNLPHLAATVSFSTFFIGIILIVSRKKAITQVIGYLVLENGICIFGSAFLGGQSSLIELAILLDVFVAVFVMGIAIFHITKEFDHIDTEKLSSLNDLITTEPGG
jgi:hydrogenase-4 component E